MRVLVTGANGFVGRAVIARLKDSVDVFAVCGLRTELTADFDGLRLVRRDLTSPAPLDDLVAEVDAVIHLAGLAHVRRGGPADHLESFRAVNVSSTERLARAAASAGVRRFIFLSSIAVNGDETYGQPYRETDSSRPTSHYGTSKAEAEGRLSLAATQNDMEFVNLRPPALVGRDAPGNLATLVRLVRMGAPLPLRSITNRRSYLGVRNLADLITLCLDHPAAANQTFLAADTPSLSTPDLIRILARHLNRPARLVPAPVAAIRSAAGLIGRESSLRALWASLDVDSSKAERLLGWTRRQSLDAALAEAVQAEPARDAHINRRDS